VVWDKGWPFPHGKDHQTGQSRIAGYWVGSIDFSKWELGIQRPVARYSPRCLHFHRYGNRVSVVLDQNTQRQGPLEAVFMASQNSPSLS